MSGFCGWIGTEPSSRHADDLLAQMSGGLPPLQQTIFSRASSSYGIIARTSASESTPADGKIVAVIDGNIDWHDPAMRAIARDQGNTTALINAYRGNGSQMLAGISGEFTLAILEPEKKRLLLAVDRLGSRPMAFSRTSDDGLVFGSTVEAIHRHPAITAKIDPQAIFNYIYFHEIPSPSTIYQNLFKLQPGEFLLYSDGHLEVESYWNPDFIDRSNESINDLQVELLDTLRHAVQRQINPSQSTACFLSGGLDSSAVAGFAAQAQREEKSGQTTAYTMGFEAAGYDEMYFSRLAAKHFNIDLREYYVTQQDIVNSMPVIAAGFDEPFGNSSAVPTLMCARRAQEDGFDHMLAGDGGDELFGGNERYAKQELFEAYYYLPRPLRSGLIEPITDVFPEFFPFGKIKSYVAQARIPMPGRLETYNFLNRAPLNVMFNTEFLNRINAAVPLQIQTERYRTARSKSLVNKMIWLDWKFTLADNDLRKVTRSCEIAGLNVGFPMLDQALIDLSLRIPPKQKVKGRNLRHMYKQALTGFLPAEIINKRKQGFGLPFGVWLATSKVIQDFLYPEIKALGERGIFLPAFLDHLLDANRTDHAAFYGNQIYVLGMLELWLKAHQADL